MYFLIENGDLLEKYNTTWGKVSTDIEKEFASETVYKKEFLKSTKFHGDEVTDFYDKEIHKVDSNQIFLALIS